jgi:hypothetical protein
MAIEFSKEEINDAFNFGCRVYGINGASKILAKEIFDKSGDFGTALSVLMEMNVGWIRQDMELHLKNII